jgi:hypothetical protein
MKNLFLFLCFLSAVVSSGQRLQWPNPDPSLSHQYTTLLENRYGFIDTNFSSLNDYHQWSLDGQDQFGRVRLGNLGQAYNQLVFSSNTSPWDVYDFFGRETINLQAEEVRFYYTRSPLTEARYRSGYERGQVFDINHTQNINKNWNAGLHYYRLNSEGNYTNELSEASKFVANSRYFNAGNGLEIVSLYIQESEEIGLNGGIADIKDFQSNTFDEQVLIPVNLNTAQREARRRLVYNDASVNLFQWPKKEVTVLDSLDMDSAKVALEETASSYFKIGHTLEYEGRKEMYVDGSANDFYTNAYLTDDDFKDSTAFYSLSNTLYLKGKIGEKSNLNLLAGIRQQYFEYSGEDFSINGNNFGLVSTLNGRLKDYIDIRASGEYILTGPLSESFKLEGTGDVKLYKQLRAFGGYKLVSSYPNVKTQFYRSNHFIWQNSFSKMLENEISYGLKWNNGGRFEIKNIFLNDYVYFNEDAVPAQNNELIVINQFQLTQNFTFWNLVHLDNRVVYQITSDANNVLPLPELVSRNALYFEFSMVKKELKCLIGTELNYFSSYSSPSFNPAMSTFFVENKYAIGNYPHFNVFANFQLKTARFYFKFEHVNQGLSGYRYYAAPDYALPARVFVAGIDWRFFN